MIENVSTQLTVFHYFAHCLLPGRAFASLYVLLFLEKEAEIGGRECVRLQRSLTSGSFAFILSCVCYAFVYFSLYVPCGHLLGKG